MTKRQKLAYNSQELTQHLKDSTGQGMNALFPAPSSPPSKPSTGEQKQEEKSGKVQAPKRARTHASPKSKKNTKPSRQARKDARMHARTIEELQRAIVNKRHLSSFTFRFKAGELERLDRVTEEINETAGQKISKNDIVRLSLNWLLQDYEQQKHASVLARTLAQA